MSKKPWVIAYRSKMSAMASGAAMITLDQRSNAGLANFTVAGTKRDINALRSDYLKVLGKGHIAHERREQDSID